MDRDQGIEITAAPLTLRLLTGEPDEMAALQRVLEAVPAYFETVTGGWPEITTLHVGVVERNVGALAFWRKLGYGETREVKMDQAFADKIIVLEKALSRG